MEVDDVSIDESSVQSAVSTEPDHDDHDEIENTGPQDPVNGENDLASPLDPALFSTTKSVSDDYAAAGDTDTNPRTPSPQTQNKNPNRATTMSPTVSTRTTPDSVPKYKIALASSLLARATGTPVSKAGKAGGKIGRASCRERVSQLV